MIDPLWWPFLLAGGVIALALLAARKRHAAAAQMAALAREARMNYSTVDRFDLATRLQQSPRWTGGIAVRDVLYGASGKDRRFVATVECRATADDRPRCLVVACVESLDHTEFREAHEPIRLRRGEFAATYREALANFQK